MSSPFIAHAISDSSSIALASGTPREMGRLFGSPLRCLSLPKLAVYTAPRRTPADSSTSRRRTPVQLAQPTAPVVHWLPRAGGSYSALPLPPHSICN